MIRFFSLALLSLAIFSCSDSDPGVNCGTRATVVDLTGLDGCGFVFELEDGTRLEPIRIFGCGTPQMNDMPKDALGDFQFIDGKKVYIDYEEIPAMSICMVGKTVVITCITEARQQSQD